jgi:phenylpyruvate tautomerase PptA (4-oxalocrotonate tautomerase family)
MEKEKLKVQKNQLIAERVSQLLAKHGRLAPKFVVADAENPKSVLHDQFTWDDSIAGPKYRLAQARRLIASVTLVITRHTHVYRSVAFVRNPRIPPSEQGYISTEELCKPKNKETAILVIDSEIKQVRARLERLRDLADVLGLRNRVDDLIAELGEFAARVAAD